MFVTSSMLLNTQQLVGNMANVCIAKTRLISRFVRCRPNLTFRQVSQQATHFPKDSYNSLKYLLGIPANTVVVTYNSSFPMFAFVPSMRFTATIPRGEDAAAAM